MSQLRADYKAVWTSLSTTKEAAYMVVSGYTDEEKFHADAEDTLDILRATTGIKPTDVFLEIGCGVGRVGRVLAPLVREWIGCDVSPNMITLAGRRLLGLPNARLQEISGYDLQPIPDASVDVVYTTVVFMHLEEWDRYTYVLEAMRVLIATTRISLRRRVGRCLRRVVKSRRMRGPRIFQNVHRSRRSRRFCGGRVLRRSTSLRGPCGFTAGA